VKHSLSNILILLLALLGIQSCRQTLLAPSPTQTLPDPLDFFWSATALDSGIYYSVTNGSSQAVTHHLFSYDDTHVFDNTSDSAAFIIQKSGDSIAIAHISVSSIFNIPDGFHFSNTFALLDKSNMIIGGSWAAGSLVHPIDSMYYIPVTKVRFDTIRDTTTDTIIRIHDTTITHDSTIVKVDSIAFAITAQVIDHVDSLHTPLYSHYADTTYGESYIIRYSLDVQNNSSYQKLPSYWLIYYTRGLGPVLIEEYLPNSSMAASRAVLLRR
jgi:hypothetical protein